MSQKRKKISLELKLELLKRFKSGEKAADIARNLNLAPTTVRTICKRDAYQIREFAKIATPLQSKQTTTKLRCSIMVKMEALLSIWIEKQNQCQKPLNKIMIQNEALRIFSDIQKDSPSSGLYLEKFEASKGWFERFKSRAKLHNVALKGESAIYIADIDTNTTNVVSEEKQLTADCISKAMQLISQAMDIFLDNDPDENRSSKVKRSIDNAINCYKEIYLEKKAANFSDKFLTTRSKPVHRNSSSSSSN